MLSLDTQRQLCVFATIADVSFSDGFLGMGLVRIIRSSVHSFPGTVGRAVLSCSRQRGGGGVLAGLREQHLCAQPAAAILNCGVVRSALLHTVLEQRCWKLFPTRNSGMKCLGHIFCKRHPVNK